ncbi:hypothetical protein ID851_13395 [Xenorhabdus sp. 5]|nr:hypothetical protein [Xenorhabdus sp. 5]
MYKSTVVIIFTLFLNCMNAFASEVSLEEKFKDVKWKGPYISDSIMDSDDDRKKVEELFSGKDILFSNGYVYIKDTCKYEYVAKKITPISYWMSEKTVEFYRLFLSEYAINIDKGLYEVSTLNPEDACGYPFSDFIIIDNVIMFVKDSGTKVVTEYAPD